MPIPLPTPRRCPACEDAESRWAFAVRGYAHVECQRCGTLFVSPLPDDETIRAVYTRPDYHADVEASAERMRHEARARAAIVAARGCKTLLEIGCGPGYFLEACAEQSIAAIGVDGGPAAARARERGLDVRDTWVDEFEPGQRFDAIALWEVIEHLPRPISTLSRLRGWIADGGVLALSTPSWSGLPARALGRRFPMITPPEHLTIFSREGLAQILARAGFAPFRWRSFSALDAPTIQRNLQRYFVGESTPAAMLAGAIAAVTAVPMHALDRARLGTSFELYAAAC